MDVEENKIKIYPIIDRYFSHIKVTSEDLDKAADFFCMRTEFNGLMLQALELETSMADAKQLVRNKFPLELWTNDVRKATIV